MWAPHPNEALESLVVTYLSVTDDVIVTQLLEVFSTSERCLIILGFNRLIFIAFRYIFLTSPNTR
jgi:hypothetical protein